MRRLLARSFPVLIIGLIGLALLPSPPRPPASLSIPTTSHTLGGAQTSVPTIVVPRPERTSGLEPGTTVPPSGGPMIAETRGSFALQASDAGSHRLALPEDTSTQASAAFTPSVADTAFMTNSTHGRIGKHPVNARSAPQSGSPVQFVLAANQSIKLGEKKNGWWHVYRGDGSDGWVYHTYLAGMPDNSSSANATFVGTTSVAQVNSIGL
jgi:hypothetical protein